MRIEAYNQVAQLYKANQSEKTQAAVKKSVSDQVEISSMGKDYQTAKKAVAEAPDLREDRIERIRNRMDSGTYQVSGEDFAARLLERYGERISF